MNKKNACYIWCILFLPSMYSMEAPTQTKKSDHTDIIKEYYLFQINPDDIENCWKHHISEIYYARLKNKDVITVEKRFSNNQQHFTCTILLHNDGMVCTLFPDTFDTIKGCFLQQMKKNIEQQNRPFNRHMYDSDSSTSGIEIAEYTKKRSSPLKKSLSQEWVMIEKK